jgi:serine/threonine protein kinase/Tfp pilus assembly protein PilF
MGAVYRGRDPRLGRDVAIKVLLPDSARDADALARFEREARAIASLSHPNVLSIFDYGDQDGTFFVVTELLEGETLRARLANDIIEWRSAVEIGAEIAEGLAAAHSRSVVHRDLKPENVFLTREGRIKILDFGLAQTDPYLTSEDTGNLPTRKFRTDPGMIVGTLAYMSPEQLKGEPVDGTADIFSLGCILYEMVTSKKPFQRGSGAATIAAILKEDVSRDELAEAVPPEFQRVIEGCVEKNPLQRFQSARDLALTLRAISSSSATRFDLLPRQRTRKSKAIDSIAVLPFQNGSADADTDYLSDGVTEGVINKLSQLPKLKVMARSTVFRYKGREVDPRAVGRDLRVRAVLSGRVKHVGDRIVINVELVDSLDGSHLWGEQYNRQIADLVTLQEEMSQEIAEKLRIRLTGAEKKRLRKTSTASTEAYQLYLKGRYQWNKRTEESLKKGIAHFQEAIESDPSFAGAYAGLADSFMTLATNIPLPPREAMPKAKSAAEQALTIDGSLAEAWASLAAVKWWYEWDWEGAEAAYVSAIKLNPNYATAHDGYGMLLCARGRFDASLEQMKKATDLDPLSRIIVVHSGWPFYFARDYESAIARFEKALELDEKFIPAQAWRGMALGQQGRYEEALQSFQLALETDRVPILLAMLGHTRAIAGQRREAELILTMLAEQAKTRYISPYDIAVIYAGLGERAAALAKLREAYEDRSAWLVFIDVDPRLDSLREEPEFTDLVTRLK